MICLSSLPLKELPAYLHLIPWRPKTAMERFLRAGDDSNSTQVIQAFDNDPSTNPDEFSLAIPDVLTPIAMSLMPPPSCQLDTIYLRNLQLSAVIGPDAWNRPDKLQPIVLSLQLQVDTSSAGSSDDIRSTFSYGQICKDVTTKLDGKTFTSIDHLTSDLAGLADDWPGDTMKLQAIAPKGMLRVEGGFGRGFSLRRIETKTHGWKTRNWQVESHEWIVKGLKLACIIGVNPHERLEKQNLSLDISIQGEADVAEYTLQIKGGFETWRRLIKSVCDVGPPTLVQPRACSLTPIRPSRSLPLRH